MVRFAHLVVNSIEPGDSFFAQDADLFEGHQALGFAGEKNPLDSERIGSSRFL